MIQKDGLPAIDLPPPTRVTSLSKRASKVFPGNRFLIFAIYLFFFQTGKLTNAIIDVRDKIARL